MDRNRAGKRVEKGTADVQVLRNVRALAKQGDDGSGVSSVTEAGILKDIRHALNSTDRVRVIRNTVGFDQTRNIRYGLGTGSPDLIGPLRSGRIFAVEVKRKGEKLRIEQVAWWMAARKWGVTGGVAHSVDEAMALLDDAEAFDRRPRGDVFRMG
jgi:hypothetical protein